MRDCHPNTDAPPSSLPTRLWHFLLTNGNQYAIIIPKIWRGPCTKLSPSAKPPFFSAFSATSAVSASSGAFQYALSSRTYWKVLEFQPFFGVKGNAHIRLWRNVLRYAKRQLSMHKKATNGAKQNDCFASPFTRDMVKCLLGPLAWTAS